jgi:hypothetical protein
VSFGAFALPKFWSRSRRAIVDHTYIVGLMVQMRCMVAIEEREVNLSRDSVHRVSLAPRDGEAVDACTWPSTRLLAMPQSFRSWRHSRLAADIVKTIPKTH